MVTSRVSAGGAGEQQDVQNPSYRVAPGCSHRPLASRQDESEIQTGKRAEEQEVGRDFVDADTYRIRRRRRSAQREKRQRHSMQR